MLNNSSKDMLIHNELFNMCRDFIQILSRHLHICSKNDVPKGPHFLRMNRSEANKLVFNCYQIA